MDDFLWGALRASLHLLIFGGTIAIIGAYVLLKDKIVFVDPEEAGEAQPTTAILGKDSGSMKELDGRYVVAVRNSARTAALDGRTDEARALQRELERMAKGEPLPGTDAEDLPALLKQLRKEYRFEKRRLAPRQGP